MLALVLTQAPRLAAPAWDAVEVPPEKAQFFALHLASALRARGLSVVTSQDIAAILGVERQKQLLGCNETGSSCMLELSNALGAQLVLTGVVAKLESSYQVNLRVLSGVDGKVVAQELVRADSQEKLLFALDDAARSLERQLEPKAPPGSARGLAWVPAVGAGVFAVAGAIFSGLALERSATLDRMLVPGVTREALAPVVSAGQTFELLGWTGFGLAAGAGVTALVLFFVGAPPAPVSFFVTPSGVGARGAF
ncbi:MAG: hypothetical protein JNM69_21835 [Archangium sp.]|nr:hypothetical protein [Archangium sp.]